MKIKIKLKLKNKKNIQTRLQKFPKNILCPFNIV